MALIDDLRDILSSEQRVLDIIKNEMLEIKNKYSDERRTSIDMTAIDYIEDEALIPVEDIVVTLTNNGYIKRVNSDTYKAQNRGGVGIKSQKALDTTSSTYKRVNAVFLKLKPYADQMKTRGKDSEKHLELCVFDLSSDFSESFPRVFI